jgi:type VI protein secretion system component VasK
MYDSNAKTLANGRFTIFMVVICLAVFLAASAAVYGLSTNRQVTAQIQKERERSIRTTCEEQNKRNKSTVRALDQLIEQAPASRRDRARQSRAGTVLLINALAPMQDCEELVRDRVKSR